MRNSYFSKTSWRINDLAALAPGDRNGEAMVVRGNLYLASSSIKNRLVDASMTKGKLIGIKAKCPS
jgi:hypothetical protein